MSKCNVTQQPYGRPDDIRRRSPSQGERTALSPILLRLASPCLRPCAHARAHAHTRTHRHTHTRICSLSRTRTRTHMRTLCGRESEREIRFLAVSFALEGLQPRKGTGGRLEGERGRKRQETRFSGDRPPGRRHAIGPGTRQPPYPSRVACLPDPPGAVRPPVP